MRSVNIVDDMPSTLADAIARAKHVEREGFTFLTPMLAPRNFTWSSFARATQRRARQLESRGLRKGDRLALLVVDEQDFVLAFAAAVAIGVIAVPMYPPLPFMRTEAYLERATSILERCAATWLIGPNSLQHVLAGLQARVRCIQGITTTEELEAYCETGQDGSYVSSAQIGPDDTCFLQFTSGSTADPKGVIVTHRNLLANANALHAVLGSDGTRDIGLNWAPLYHDMGLIGSVVAPLLSLGRQVFIPTATFAMRPQVWLEVANQYRCTMLSTNNFGLRAAVKRPPRNVVLDLSCIRVISVGAEPVHPDALADFARTFEPCGLNPRALNPAYGMAEATLAISANDPAHCCRVLHVQAEAYRNNLIQVEPANATDNGSPARREHSIALVSCGRVIPGHEVVIVDAQDEPLPEGHVGHIKLRGPSVTPGYFADQEATAALGRGGWLDTGDLGFFQGGELFVSGRTKDIVLIAGRNYHPEVVERAATRVPGIRAGHAVAFSVPAHDTERLVVIAECENPRRVESLAAAVRSAILSDIGLDASDVVIVLPCSLPKTSSGKLRRAEAKRVYQAGAVRPLASETA
jgi:fatty-acyl-CoA synthase